jgi:hypothetical protein
LALHLPAVIGTQPHWQIHLDAQILALLYILPFLSGDFSDDFIGENEDKDDCHRP